VDATQRWKPRELYWLTRHGIRMSGMPAWQFHMADEDIWAVVGFLQKLPALTPQQYAQATTTTAAATASAATFATTNATSAAPACNRPPSSPASAMRPPDRLRGATALAQYACSACHTIPGIPGSHPQVGPPLAGIGRRTVIAGKLANTPENMVVWITRTHEIDPKSAMPSLEVSQEDARDMAAYLSALD
jgi:mono/diheme cytochrome c family protein